MNQSYRISKKALEDLEGIWLFTYQRWSLEQADKYFHVLMDEIEILSTNFDHGKSVDHIKPGYRCTRAQSHFIFYKRANDGLIEIVRVLHQRMDIENWL